MASDEKLSTYTNISSGSVLDEFKYVEGVTPGTIIASKSIITDSSKDISSINNINITGQLELTSTTKELIPPRLTTAQKNAIASPNDGDIVYDTDLEGLYIYEDSTWNKIENEPYALVLQTFGGPLPLNTTYTAGTEDGVGVGSLIPVFGYAAIATSLSVAVIGTLAYEFIPDSVILQNGIVEWGAGWVSGDSFCIRMEQSTDGVTWTKYFSVLFEFDNRSSPAYVSGTSYRGQWYASSFHPRFIGRFNDMGGTRPANLPANTLFRNYIAWVSGSSPVGNEDSIVINGFYKIPNPE